MIEFANGSI